MIAGIAEARLPWQSRASCNAVRRTRCARGQRRQPKRRQCLIRASPPSPLHPESVGASSTASSSHGNPRVHGERRAPPGGRTCSLSSRVAPGTRVAALRCPVESQHDLVVEDLPGAAKAIALVEGHRGSGAGDGAGEQRISAGIVAKEFDHRVDCRGAVTSPLESRIDQELPQEVAKRVALVSRWCVQSHHDEADRDVIDIDRPIPRTCPGRSSSLLQCIDHAIPILLLLRQDPHPLDSSPIRIRDLPQRDARLVRRRGTARSRVLSQDRTSLRLGPGPSEVGADHDRKEHRAARDLPRNAESRPNRAAFDRNALERT